MYLLGPVVGSHGSWEGGGRWGEAEAQCDDDEKSERHALQVQEEAKSRGMQVATGSGAGRSRLSPPSLREDPAPPAPCGLPSDTDYGLLSSRLEENKFVFPATKFVVNCSSSNRKLIPWGSLAMR